MTHTLVKGDSFVSFIPQGLTTQVRVFRGYDIQSVETLTTPAARRLYKLRLSDGYVVATPATVTHDVVGGMLYEGRY